jgi:membrane-associated phospholipid phosphatase
MTISPPTHQPTESAAPPTVVRRRARNAAIAGLVSAVGFVVLLLSTASNPAAPWFVATDLAWHDFIVGTRTEAGTAIQHVIDLSTGGPIGGSVIMIVPLIVLLVLRRWWAALFYGVGVLLTGTLVQVAKYSVSRARPDDPLVIVDFGSFPSGHVAGFSFFVIAMCLLINRRWTWIAGVILIIVSVVNRTYVSAHWLSDTLAGLTLGATVAFLLWAALARLIARQPRAKKAKVSA